MLLDKRKHMKPGLINIGCRDGGGGGLLLGSNIEGVVRKLTPVFQYSQHFLSKIV